ncbi:P-loop containing nucleoside triphosphate hydrolase protein [Abortiporus biennis]|nr:P-loop containing nucleoside triphosphate hydrolase protein [Abortiporus biennis]
MRCALSRVVRSRLTRGYATTKDIVLRPYQESCLEACTDALNSGATRIGVSLPTGSGKTTVFISLLSRILPPKQYPKAKQSLVIVNSVELALQAASQAERLCPDWRVEVEQGAKHKASGTADVTVATYQTLLQENRLAKFDPKSLKTIIVDEAHHAAAPSYRRILSHFHSAVKNPDPTFVPPAIDHQIPIFGFSATFSRHDGMALGSVFERIVYHRDFLEMIKEEWLCNVRFTSVKANIDLSQVTVSSRTGDFNPTSLAHIINTSMINQLVVQTWLDRTADRKTTLVFCVNLAHVRELTNAFRAAGVDARYIHSGTLMKERTALVSEFRAGTFPVLVNCAILTEGADIPNIDCVVVARPTRSRNVFAQMIGRGMRLSPGTGKTDCRIIDFVDSLSRVPGVVSTPTLFGLDPSEIVDDQTTEELEQRADALYDADLSSASGSDTKDNIPEPKTVTYTDHEDPFALVHEASGAPHIQQMSKNAWVGCGGDVYVLECLGKGYIRIEPVSDKKSTNEDGNFVAHYTPATLPAMTAFTLKVSPYQRSRKVLTATTLVEAVRGCDTYATKKVIPGTLALGLLRSAKWRRTPATDSQKAFVKKRWKLVDVEDTPNDKFSRLTKEEAANIITRLKHGAHSRYQAKSKATKREAEQRAKESRRRAREHVQVGPLPS